MSSRKFVRSTIKPAVFWAEGMKLGPGAKLEPYFWERIESSRRTTGDGTVHDPKVIWLFPGPSRNELKNAPAIEAIIKQLAREYGLSYAWLA